MGERLRVALISEVFCDVGAGERLTARLREARRQGVELAVLPELALVRWAPATQEARDEDAEAPGGPRELSLREAAHDAAVAVLGGAIVRDAAGRRRNRALLVDEHGDLVGRYDKLHLPEEPGFWESHHYEPGQEPPRVLELERQGFPLGVQVCSDINRPEPALALAAAGAEAILHPRATEPDTWEDWKLVLRAVARTASAWVLSVNRPAPEGGTPLGGPSIAIDPMGRVVAETTGPLLVVDLEREAVRRARVDYPGYLALRPALYARAWEQAEAAPRGPGRR